MRDVLVVKLDSNNEVRMWKFKLPIPIPKGHFVLGRGVYSVDIIVR